VTVGEKGVLLQREASLRKIIAFDDATYSALKLLAGDRMSTLQELADEAFADLLKKHGRPVDLKDALRQSLRRFPANDPRPARPRHTPRPSTRPRKR
jgi:hypothetical protein